MFKSYEFIYAGLPSSMFSLVVCDVDSNKHSDNSFGNKAKILETRIPGRVRPLHHGVDYHEEPLRFKLIFGSDRELDRYDIQEISMWLTGYQQYQWLYLEQPDMANIGFKCLVQNLTPITIGWLPYAFEAEIVCDCPYAYGDLFVHTFSFSDGDELRIFNSGTARVYCLPQMTIVPTTGCAEIAIENLSDTNGDGGIFRLTKLPADGIEIFVDNENCILTETSKGFDLYDGFSDKFLQLVPGDNVLRMTGSGTLTLTGQYYYNVGA